MGLQIWPTSNTYLSQNSIEETCYAFPLCDLFCDCSERFRPEAELIRFSFSRKGSDQSRQCSSNEFIAPTQPDGWCYPLFSEVTSSPFYFRYTCGLATILPPCCFDTLFKIPRRLLGTSHRRRRRRLRPPRANYISTRRPSATALLFSVVRRLSSRRASHRCSRLIR